MAEAQAFSARVQEGEGSQAWFTVFASASPIGSMYGLFTYIYHKNQPTVGINIPYIHGSYGSPKVK